MLTNRQCITKNRYWMPKNEISEKPLQWYDDQQLSFLETLLGIKGILGVEASGRLSKASASAGTACEQSGYLV